jgi:site-specific DNA-methyltransferase (adenine-specific)
MPQEKFMNQLHYGDCFEVMTHMEAESIDLMYLDPPFNSNRMYNAIYKDVSGRPLPDQVNAFCDMWEFTYEREQTMRNIPILARAAGLDDHTAEFWKHWMEALRYGQPGLLSYLLYMMERLVAAKRVLKSTGTIYLHCDSTASHYLKIMMDGIFGAENFRNEIIWCYRGGGVPKRDFARKHDTIFRYSKSDEYIFNLEGVRGSYSEDSKERLKYKAKSFRGEKVYDNYEPHPEGKHPEDWWLIQPIAPSSKERVGYPTQKPLTLLKRVIQASSNEGDVVMDPFCGCASTVCAAHELKRKWIGIDIAYFAVRDVARRRLHDSYHLVENKDYQIAGIPRTLEGARDIWERDKYQFQRWAVEYIDGFVTSKRTADRGVDGRLYFDHPNHRQLQTMILEVKGGKNIDISSVRSLRGAMERESAMMGGLVVLERLSERSKRNFMREMSEAGSFHVHGIEYPRMQLLSVEEMLDGRRFKTPSVARLDSGQGVLG